jgi:hypothetical protein
MLELMLLLLLLLLLLLVRSRIIVSLWASLERSGLVSTHRTTLFSTSRSSKHGVIRRNSTADLIHLFDYTFGL